MHHFAYKTGVLHAENVDLRAIAEAVGTPFYCYSEATIRRHIRVFREAVGAHAPLIAYSVKANSNLAVLNVLASEGAGADVVSGGELARALAAGIAPEKIVFSGVGKTRDELRAGLVAGIHQFNVESAAELSALNVIAGELQMKAPIAIRVNPDVAAGGHAKISTGKKHDKFGVPFDDARELYAEARGMPWIAIHGVDMHIGSQIDALAPFEIAFARLSELVVDLRRDGCAISCVDLGGGLGIPYGDTSIEPPSPSAYAALIKPMALALDADLIFEPGRMIVGNAGVLVARVTYTKRSEGRRFVILDAGMNDLARPALYDAYHELKLVSEPDASAQMLDHDVVGPVCETGDRFAEGRSLPPLAEGDLVAFMSAGAYGAVQASEYNTRPCAPEVLVNGEKWAVIRNRPSIEAVLARDKIPEWL